MKLRLLILILWPAFLVAGLAEGLLFSFIRPEDLIFFGHHLALADEGIYTLGFFIIWIFCALSSALSLYILPARDEDSESNFDSGLI